MSDESDNNSLGKTIASSRESDHHYGTYVPQNLLTHVKQIHGGVVKMTHHRSTPHVDHSYRAMDPDEPVPGASKQSEIAKSTTITTPVQKLKPHFVTVSKTQRSVSNPSGESRIIYYPPIFSNKLTPELKNQLATELKTHLATEYKINHITSQHGKRPKLLHTQTKGTETNTTTALATPSTAIAGVTMTPQSLRAKLHQELENKAKTCSYLPHKCSLSRIQGFDYCMSHILEDPRAPYKQCSFVYTSNGKRCPNAAPKVDVKQTVSYCYEHSRHAQNLRTRSLGKFRPPLTMESAYAKLAHYVKLNEVEVQEEPENLITTYVLKKTSTPMAKTLETKKVLAPVDPLNDIILDKIDMAHNILNYASESDSDEEATVYNNVNQHFHLENSDDESVETQETDPLQHAGIYTAEEANRIMRDKLIRLQTLYVEQVRVLHHNLKNKRMKYLTNIRREQETLCSIKNQVKDTPKEVRLYEKLKAYHSYQKRSGIEAVLHERSMEKKAKLLEGIPYKSISPGTRCIFTEGGVKCADRALHSCKYCKKHILEDKRQILFKACGVEMNGVSCREPVTGLLDIHTCWIHYKVPEPRSYNIRKDSSDSDNSEDDLNVMEIDEIYGEQYENQDVNEYAKFEMTSNPNNSDTMDQNYDTMKLAHLTTQTELENVTFHKEHLESELLRQDELEQCLLGPLLQSEDSQEEILDEPALSENEIILETKEIFTEAELITETEEEIITEAEEIITEAEEIITEAEEVITEGDEITEAEEIITDAEYMINTTNKELLDESITEETLAQQLTTEDHLLHKATLLENSCDPVLLINTDKRL